MIEEGTWRKINNTKTFQNSYTVEKSTTVEVSI